jgi:O-antigen ligase
MMYRKGRNNIILIVAVFYLALLSLSVLLNDRFLQIFSFAIPFALFFGYLAVFYPRSYLFGLFLLLPVSVNLEEIALGIGVSIPGELLTIPFALFVLANMFKGNLIRRSDWKHPITVLLLLNLLWMLVTTFFSAMPWVSIKYLFIRVIFVLVFYVGILQYLRDSRQGAALIWAFVLSLGTTVVWATLKHSHFGFIQEVNAWAPQPFFEDHTVYGATLALVFPLSLMVLFFGRKKFPLPWLSSFILFPLIIAGLLLSYSRAVWLSLGVMLLMALILLFRVEFKFVVGGICVLVVVILGLRGPILERLNEVQSERSSDLREHLMSSANINSSISNLERINRWKSAWDMFLDRPATGFGPGTYQFQYAPYQDDALTTRISTWHGDVGGAHSEYLKPLSESGILGLVTFVALIMVVLKSGFRVLKKSPHPEDRFLAAAIILGLTTYYIHGLFNYFLHTDKVAALFWGMSAMITMMDNRLTVDTKLRSNVF